MRDTFCMAAGASSKRAGAIVAAVASISLLHADSPSSASKLRVAYVTPVITTPSPRDLWGQGLLGFHRAVRDFAVEGRVVQSDPKSWAKTMTSVARQKFDLIFPGLIATERDFDLLVRLADQFPQSKFVVAFAYEAFQTRPKNVQGADFRAEEGAYLAGYLAALMERRKPGKDVISSVGGYKIFVVDQFIAGYQAGARKANPRVTTLNGYSKSFADPAKCKATALRQIGKGSGVVFNVAGECGPGTLQAAREKNVWAIGVDVDQSFFGPHVLTSAMKRHDVWVYRTIRDLVNGKFSAGRSVVWNLRSGAVGLGRISSRVPRTFVRQVERVRAQIIAGEIKVPNSVK